MLFRSAYGAGNRVPGAESPSPADLSPYPQGVYPAMVAEDG